MNEEINYKYETDENGNFITKEISKDFTNTIIKDKNGNVIYENVYGVEKKTNIEYDENNDELIESGNVYDENITIYKKHNLQTGIINKQEYLNGVLNVDSLEQHLNENTINQTILYGFENEPEDEYYDISINNRLNNNNKKIEKIHPDYIYENEYDKNENLLSQKCYKSEYETKYKYDDFNELIKKNNILIIN